MSDIQTQSREPRRPRASHAAFLGIAVLVLAVVVLAGSLQPTQAAASKVDIAYISVTDEGPSARAWFDGAPSPGLHVQEALNRFAEKGYKIVEVTFQARPQAAEATGFVILLQRER